MPKQQDWRFAATSKEGKTVTGTTRASDAREASDHISAQGLIPISVEPIRAGWIPRFVPGVKPRALVVFARQFATLVDAGLPILTALDMLSDLTEDPALRAGLTRVARAVNGGSSLSGALGDQPEVFPPILVHMVQAGEAGGQLPESLNRTSDYLENAQDLRDRFVGAMVYPGVVLSAAALAVVVVLTFVVPVFSDLFAAEGLVLPFSTQLLVRSSEIIIAYWQYLIAGLLLAFVLAARLLGGVRGRRWIDAVLIRLPIVGDLVRKAAVARATRAMASMVASGVMLSEALLASARIAGNSVVGAAFMEARDSIQQGSDLSTPFATSKVLPRLLGQMVRVGEESGRLDEMLTKVADFFEMEVKVAIDGAMKMLEPTMIILLGGVLGGIIIAMYAPIFDLMTAMR